MAKWKTTAEKLKAAAEKIRFEPSDDIIKVLKYWLNRIYLLVNIKVMNKEKEFNDYRSRMNDRLLETDDKIIKRIYNLDTNAFLDGHLNKKTKELIGLTTSLVLRCDDCVKYHLGKCYELKFKTEEIIEAMSVSTLIGGTIVIPHLRKAVEYWDELNKHV